MNLRKLRSSDLVECLSIDPRSAGKGSLGAQGALRVWKTLIDDPAFGSAVIEDATATSGRAILSFGASLFIRSDYADTVIQETRPDLNSRLFGDMAAGEEVICPAISLTSFRKEDGLDLVLLCSSFLHDVLTPEQQIEAGMLLPQALVHAHTGFPIKRIIMETTNERMRVLAANSGVWRPVAQFPKEDRALFVVTREAVLSSAGFALLSPLFHWRAPVLQLREVDKHLLSEALNGETDAELAATMYLSLSSIKKRWGSLFVHIGRVMPELLPEAKFPADEDRRGSQKRHHVLAYARAHPEELRPFRSYPRTAPASRIALRRGLPASEAGSTRDPHEIARTAPARS